MKLADAYSKFASKGPVRIPGAQRTAGLSWRVLKPHLTEEEKTFISIALSHAWDTGEGRTEFDAVMAAVGRRLGFKR